VRPEHKPSPLDHQVLEQAAEWFATLADEAVTDEERAAWQHWLGSDPAHQRAWQYVDRVGQSFFQAQQQAGKQGAGRIISATRTDRISRRKLLAGSIAALAGIVTWRYTPLGDLGQRHLNGWASGYRTATGETAEFSLADGGQLWLNTASAADVSYLSDMRIISLYQGEILVQTAADTQQRPFVVDTSLGRLRALGTRFSVQQHLDHVSLAVFEGAVEVTTAKGTVAVIAANTQSRFNVDEIESPLPVQQSRQAWTRGLLVASNIPLGEVVAQLSRYRHGHLGVDPRVASIPVVGTFPVSKPDHVLSMLEGALPVRVNRIMPWWVTIEPR